MPSHGFCRDIHNAFVHPRDPIFPVGLVGKPLALSSGCSAALLPGALRATAAWFLSSAAHEREGLGEVFFFLNDPLLPYNQFMLAFFYVPH